MKKGDIYKFESKSRQLSDAYIRILDIFKPGTYQYRYEKEKLGSDGEGIRGTLIRYERSDSSKFEYVYTNYMTRKDFLYHFKKTK